MVSHWKAMTSHSLVDLRRDEGDHHVGLPGRPAEGEDEDDHHQHLDHLEWKNKVKNAFQSFAQSEKSISTLGEEFCS